jgi:hypothetical protein
VFEQRVRDLFERETLSRGLDDIIQLAEIVSLARSICLPRPSRPRNESAFE